MRIVIEPFVGEKYAVELPGEKPKVALEDWIRHNIRDVKRYSVLEEINAENLVTPGEEIPAEAMIEHEVTI